MSKENVLKLFFRITGEDENENAYDDMAVCAIEDISNILTKSELTEAEAARCEYAAACCAAYKWACEKQVGETLCMTENGGAYKGCAVSAEDALRLKNEAFAGIIGIAEDRDFLFSAIE